MAIRIRTHPGEILREEFLVPLGMTAWQLALALDVPANRITELVRERRSVTGDTAVRLARYFGTTAEFWANLQTAHDLSRAQTEAHYTPSKTALADLAKRRERAETYEARGILLF